MRWGAGIPIRDDAVRIQHEDCVIGDAADKKPKASFALAKLRQRLLQLPGA
jgi:hypothetical protein